MRTPRGVYSRRLLLTLLEIEQTLLIRTSLSVLRDGHADILPAHTPHANAKLRYRYHKRSDLSSEPTDFALANTRTKTISPHQTVYSSLKQTPLAAEENER